jgi:restriction system protein
MLGMVVLRKVAENYVSVTSTLSQYWRPGLGHYPGVHMARRHSVLAELQRELARRERLQQQARRAAAQAAMQQARQRDQAMRAAARQAAATERERKQLYIADRKAQAAAMASDIHGRTAELNAVLAAGTCRPPGLSFASLRRTLDVPPFDPGGLGAPFFEPRWEQFVPQQPSGLGKMFGGAARFDREQAAARAAYESEVAKYRAAEADRQTRLADLRHAYDQQAAEAAQTVATHNAEIDQFERDFRAYDPEAVAQFFTLVLDASAYPEGFPHRTPSALPPRTQRSGRRIRTAAAVRGTGRKGF